jgi:hypothetical protein
MNKSIGGDKSLNLFDQLVAAMLNVKLGNNDSCIEDTIDYANLWLSFFPVGSNVSSSSYAWSLAAPLLDNLDDYNNGKLCAPHRD